MSQAQASRFRPEEERAMEEAFANDREAHVLLDLIDVEFRTDPMSVQCFDNRIVDRVRMCVSKRQKDPRLR